MPKITTEDMIALSIRLRAADAAKVNELAQKEGTSVAHLLRQMIEDQIHMMSLPGPIEEVLSKDAKAQGLDPSYCRKYLIHLLTLRYGDILTGKAKKTGR